MGKTTKFCIQPGCTHVGSYLTEGTSSATNVETISDDLIQIHDRFISDITGDSHLMAIGLRHTADTDQSI